MGVSKNSGTPKSSILIGFSVINHLFWGSLFLETPRFWGVDIFYKSLRIWLRMARCIYRTWDYSCTLSVDLEISLFGINNWMQEDTNWYKYVFIYICIYVYLYLIYIYIYIWFQFRWFLSLALFRWRLPRCSPSIWISSHRSALQRRHTSPSGLDIWCPVQEFARMKVSLLSCVQLQNYPKPDMRIMGFFMMDLSDTHVLATKDSKKKIPMDSSTQVIPYFMIMPLSAAYIMACISTLPGLGPEARWNGVRLKRGCRWPRAAGVPLCRGQSDQKATLDQRLGTMYLYGSTGLATQQHEKFTGEAQEVDLRFVGFLWC